MLFTFPCSKAIVPIMATALLLENLILYLNPFPMLQNSNQPYSYYVLTAIETIKKHIDDNPFQYEKVVDLLSYLNTPNRNIVVNAFKDLHGMGIKRYMVRKRLEHSKNFLESGMDLKMIASQCFYSNQNSFSRAFKAAFLITPTDWLDMLSDV